MKFLKDLSKQELIDLITQYDSYIVDICEDSQNTIYKHPVGISEFLNNEFADKE